LLAVAVEVLAEAVREVIVVQLLGNLLAVVLVLSPIYFSVVLTQ
jgi:hypothetical protein